MTFLRNIKAALAAVAILPLLSACFTGVESTPKIDASAVKKENAGAITPEQRFLADIKADAPAKWITGKRFRVTDDRISLIFGSPSDSSEGLTGTDIYYQAIQPARTLTGDDAMRITFKSSDGRKFFYDVAGMTQERIDTIQSLQIPFTIDTDMVALINERLIGKDYFVRTPLWYDAKGDTERGLRHIRVHIDSVVPGDANFDARVCFSIPDEHLASLTGNRQHYLLMSTGDSKAATRNFDVLFAFDNPRKAHPEIKDDVWELIIRSRVRLDMTREECRLALGNPPEVLRTPTTIGMRERWTFPDGVFLIFDDGYLTRFRQ